MPCFRRNDWARGVLLLGGIWSCSGSGDQAVGPFESEEEAESDKIQVAPSFAEVYERVFVPGLCTESTCHGLENQGGRLDLSSEEIAYEQLLEVAASGPGCVSTGWLRVVPGDAETSMLWLKLTPQNLPCGRLMPPTAAHLDEKEIELVRQWIEGGALR